MVQIITSASLLVARLFAALIDGQEAILDGHRQDSHRSAVGGAELRVVPGSGRGLVIQQRLVQMRTEELPIVSAELEGGLRTVIERVEEESSLPPVRRIAKQEVAGPQHFRRVMLALATDFQGEDAGPGAGHGHSSALSRRLIAESAGPPI